MTTRSLPAASRRTPPPAQRRSRETMDRFAAAAEELLQDRPFEKISIQDIARRAARPVGSFYARFASKDALLPHLYDRYDAGLEPLFRARIERLEARARDLDAATAGVVDLLLGLYQERRWLLRAVSLFARARPDALPPDLVQRRRRLFDRLGAILLRHRGEIVHPDPGTAVRFGIFLVASVARERLLFGEAPHARVTPIGKKALRDELVRTIRAYLKTGVNP